MLDSSDNPFLITHTADDEETLAPVIPENSTTEDEKGDVAGLIPLCARHAKGPQVNSKVFGYDIGQMQSRPWSEPGANLRDYFNYDFNETSWRLYCSMQAEGEASLLARANAFLSQLNGAARPGAGEEAGEPFYAQPQAGGPSHPYYGAPREGYAKTRPCQRFAEGTCTKGNQCNYSHSFGDVRHHHHHPHHHHHNNHHHNPHHHHHQHQHQHHLQQHQQQSYALPPYRNDQGVLPPMGAPSVGVLDTFQGGEYRGMPKRARSPVEREK